MSSLSSILQEEYERWEAEIGDDEYGGPSTLGIFDVLRAHFLIAEFFQELGSGLGGVGPRDLNLLHSCLYRQHPSFGGIELIDSRYEACATLFFGIIKDHPFHDANKRTALLSLLYHLQKIGRCPTISQKQLEDFSVLVAEGQLRKFARYNDLKKSKSPNPEVKFIAYHLKKNTRKLDKRYYAITYRQLDRIIRKFGFALANPRGNFIDVVRTKEKRKIFGIIGEKERVDVKVCQIGFPGWSSEVGKGAISTVRRCANLTDQKGVDSATFFKGEDPIDCLIAEYQRPLIALADR